MKIIKVFVFIYLAIFMSSCMPEVSEVWYNENGGARAKTTLNIGESFGMFAGTLKDMQPDPQNTGEVDIFAKIREGEFIDSTFSLYSVMPDSIKNKVQNPEVLDKFLIDIKMDKKQKVFQLSLEMSYEDEKEKEEIKRALQSTSEDKNDQQGDISSIFNEHEIDLEKGIITLKNANPMMDSNEDKKEMLNMVNSLDSLENVLANWDKQKDENGNPYTEEEKLSAEFMRSMLAPMLQGSTKFIIHAPRQIISSNIKGAKIKGNTISYEENMRDMLKNTEQKIIKFKK